MYMYIDVHGRCTQTYMVHAQLYVHRFTQIWCVDVRVHQHKEGEQAHKTRQGLVFSIFHHLFLLPPSSSPFRIQPWSPPHPHPHPPSILVSLSICIFLCVEIKKPISKYTVRSTYGSRDLCHELPFFIRFRSFLLVLVLLLLLLLLLLFDKISSKVSA